MVTKEDLQERYAKMPTEDLLEITKDKSGCTELAISVACDELRHRRVPREEIINYRPVLGKISEMTIKNCLIDLSFWQKVLYFYVLWFPKARYYYQPGFMQNGYILKDNQSNYYSIVGGISFFVAIGYSFSSNSMVVFICTSIVLFFLCYLFDIYYNRDRQMKNIQKAVDQGEIPWGF